MKFKKTLSNAIALVALSTPLGWGRQPNAEFDAVRLSHDDHSSAIQRACAIGFRNLRAFFESTGAPFDPKLVSSHKGRYCHLMYEPTVRGFRAAAIQDRVTAVLFDSESSPAVKWAGSLAKRAIQPVQLIPVPRNVIADSDWNGLFVQGIADGHPLLLRARSALERAPDLVPWKVRASRLPWDARDIAIVRGAGGDGKTTLLYGDQLRASWHGLREEERAFVLRTEFGVDEALHVPLAGKSLGEVLVPGESGLLAASESLHPSEAAHIRERLKRAGIALQAPDAKPERIPARLLLLRTVSR